MVLKDKENENKRKREVKNHWSERETDILIELAILNKSVINASFGPGVTNEKRNKVWKTVTETIAIECPNDGKKSEADVKKKWQNVLALARKDIGKFNNSFSQTGGGHQYKMNARNTKLYEEWFGKNNPALSGSGIEGGVETDDKPEKAALNQTESGNEGSVTPYFPTRVVQDDGVITFDESDFEIEIVKNVNVRIQKESGGGGNKSFESETFDPSSPDTPKNFDSAAKEARPTVKTTSRSTITKTKRAVCALVLETNETKKKKARIELLSSVFQVRKELGTSNDASVIPEDLRELVLDPTKI